MRHLGLFVMHDEAHRRFGVIFRNRKPALLEENQKIRERGADVIHAVRLAERRGGAHKCIEHKKSSMGSGFAFVKSVCPETEKP